MSKIKVKKQSTFIDMTAMSDVTVLLLTFFMLTSTFIQKEPIQVNTPASVSEIKIPEVNVLSILVDSNGKIFLGLDNPTDREETLKAVGEDYHTEFTDPQIKSFKSLTTFGVPIGIMDKFLELSTEKQDEYLRNIGDLRVGIPTDTVEVRDAQGTVISSDNEFKHWIAHAKRVNKERQQELKDQGKIDQIQDLKIAIKADKTTPYPVIKKVMDDLRGMRENRYLLITNLKTASSE